VKVDVKASRFFGVTLEAVRDLGLPSVPGRRHHQADHVMLAAE
jgi:hypothetical protein